jgi:hypothetical protein
MKEVIEHYYRTTKETNIIKIEDIEIYDWLEIADIFVESPKLKKTLYTVIIYYKGVSQVSRYDLDANDISKIRNYNLDLILG